MNPPPPPPSPPPINKDSAESSQQEPSKNQSKPVKLQGHNRFQRPYNPPGANTNNINTAPSPHAPLPRQSQQQREERIRLAYEQEHRIHEDRNQRERAGWNTWSSSSDNHYNHNSNHNDYRPAASGGYWDHSCNHNPSHSHNTYTPSYSPSYSLSTSRNYQWPAYAPPAPNIPLTPSYSTTRPYNHHSQSERVPPRSHLYNPIPAYRANVLRPITSDRRHQFSSRETPELLDYQYNPPPPRLYPQPSTPTNDVESKHDRGTLFPTPSSNQQREREDHKPNKKEQQHPTHSPTTSNPPHPHHRSRPLPASLTSPPPAIPAFGFEFKMVQPGAGGSKPGQHQLPPKPPPSIEEQEQQTSSSTVTIPLKRTADGQADSGDTLPNKLRKLSLLVADSENMAAAQHITPTPVPTTTMITTTATTEINENTVPATTDATVGTLPEPMTTDPTTATQDPEQNPNQKLWVYNPITHTPCGPFLAEDCGICTPFAAMGVGDKENNEEEKEWQEFRFCHRCLAFQVVDKVVGKGGEEGKREKGNGRTKCLTCGHGMKGCRECKNNGGRIWVRMKVES
ncbi:hypothetical protein EX30DRAFT_347260 [Ascodesmis nigricans]|uniref:Uncharacterized protein n=1 Tax=Ascodesmis nigricans TaxID=341454 RepID=A0A4S2N1A9_9PEZI|nr:hypothetical protein EX30DRAFT_347260 [Ascodesmis nigricans]